MQLVLLRQDERLGWTVRGRGSSARERTALRPERRCALGPVPRPMTVASIRPGFARILETGFGRRRTLPQGTGPAPGPARVIRVAMSRLPGRARPPRAFRHPSAGHVARHLERLRQSARAHEQRRAGPAPFGRLRIGGRRSLAALPGRRGGTPGNQPAAGACRPQRSRADIPGAGIKLSLTTDSVAAPPRAHASSSWKSEIG